MFKKKQTMGLSRWNKLKESAGAGELLSKLGVGESPIVGLQRAVQAMALLRKARPPTPPPPVEYADEECQTEGSYVERTHLVACCEKTFSICGQAMRVLVGKGGSQGAAEAVAVIDVFQQLKSRGDWSDGQAETYVEDALRALLRQIERLQVTVMSPSDHIRQGLHEATEMFDASAEGQQLNEEKVTEGLRHLAKITSFKKQARSIKQYTFPAVVTRMEEMARRAAARWHKRKTEILQQRAAGILRCMTAMHGLGSNGEELPFFRTLARHRDGTKYSFWALQSDGISELLPGDASARDHSRPHTTASPGSPGHFRSSRTRPSGYTGRYLSRVVKAGDGEYARVLTARDTSESPRERPRSASPEESLGPEPPSEPNAPAPESPKWPAPAGVGIRPIELNSWSQSLERGFRLLPATVAGTIADGEDRQTGAWTERQQPPLDKANWDLPPPPKQPKTARVHTLSSRQVPHWLSGSAAQERLHQLTRGGASDGGPAFSRFDTDVSSPNNVIKTQRWLGNLSPKSSFFRAGQKALQPLESGSKGAVNGSSGRRALAVDSAKPAGSGPAAAWLAPTGTRVAYSSRETS